VRNGSDIIRDAVWVLEKLQEGNMQASTGDADDGTELTRINERIGEAERDKNRTLIDAYLSDDLIFFRAGGKVDNKQEYLEGLTSAANYNERLDWEVRQVTVRGDHALVVVDVTLVGTRGGTPVDGVFRNFRTFMKQEDGWQLVIWANAKLQTP
jgi:ketosteroid isomerase-like protein